MVFQKNGAGKHRVAGIPQQTRNEANHPARSGEAYFKLILSIATRIHGCDSAQNLVSCATQEKKPIQEKKRSIWRANNTKRKKEPVIADPARSYNNPSQEREAGAAFTKARGALLRRPVSAWRVTSRAAVPGTPGFCSRSERGRAPAVCDCKTPTHA
jgi:hypothetical protein